VLFLFLLSSNSQAHDIGVSSAEIFVSDNKTVDVSLAFKGIDLEKAIGTVFVDRRNDRVRVADLAVSTGAIQTYLRQKIVVRADGKSCPMNVHLPEADRDGVVIGVRFFCPPTTTRLEYASRLLLDVDSRAVHNLLVIAGDDIDQTVLDRHVNMMMLTGDPPTRLATFGRYVRAGVEHIFIGYDHIAFLLALLLWANRILVVVAVVTAFTAAHSITLGLAMFDLVVLPTAIVEPLIAATVVWAAIENYFSRDVGRRWRIALPLGLIHGFGFAGVLASLGLPAGALGLALAGFNIGVEIGQVVIVAVVVSFLLLTDRFADKTWLSRAILVRTGSAIIAGLGLYWLVTRLLVVYSPVGPA
jgi:hydrogenase/urease accessory protein HupE